MNAESALIAVVDDEASIRTALKRLLRSEGMKVEVFVDGKTFLDSLSEQVPDCVVLDIHMPNMTGFDVLDHLKRIRSSLPAIMLTGRDSSETQAHALASGCVAYLFKPIDAEALLAAIHSAIHGALNPGSAS